MKARFFKRRDEFEIDFDPKTDEEVMDKLLVWIRDTLGLERDVDTELTDGQERIRFVDLLEYLDNPVEEELEHFQKFGLRPGIVLRGKRWFSSLDVEYSHLTVSDKEPFKSLSKAVTKWLRDGRRIKGEKTLTLIENKIEELLEALK